MNLIIENHVLSIDVEIIREEIVNLLPRIDGRSITLTNIDQLCLHGTCHDDSPFHGLGTNYDLDPFKETDFTENLFSDLMPYTYQILDDLGLYRARIMGLPPRRCYRYHRDDSRRIHIPIITTDTCFLAFNDGLHHLPANGSYYDVDTTQRHTAINASMSTHRVHLIGNR